MESQATLITLCKDLASINPIEVKRCDENLETFSSVASSSTSANESNKENVDGNVDIRKSENKPRPINEKQDQVVRKITKRLQKRKVKVATVSARKSSSKQVKSSSNSGRAIKSRKAKNLQTVNNPLEDEMGNPKTLIKCLSCSKSFSHRGNLLRHQKVHTGEKRFACPICNKIFRENCNMKRHFKAHLINYKTSIQSSANNNKT